jgi:hypothetical protein
VHPRSASKSFSHPNTPSEIDEKRALDFDAGATEVWICNLAGSITFFVSPDHQAATSASLPSVP